MSVSVLLHAIGTIPLFASRAFLPAFLTALFFRYPDLVPFMEKANVPSAEIFITQTPVLWVLGILAVAEILADKNTSIKTLWIEAEPYLKPLVYAIMLLNVVDDNSKAVLQSIYQAGMGDYIVVVFTAGCVYGLTLLRKTIEERLLEIDPDGDLYLNFIFSSIEDTFVFFGFLLLVISGSVAIVFFGIIVLILYVWQRRIRASEDKQKVSCIACQKKIAPFALECYHCHCKQPQVHKIGFLGQKKEKLVGNTRNHAFDLLAQQRCAYCATRTNKAVCPACTKPNLLIDKHMRQAYLMKVQKRYALWFPISIALGLIPILGIAFAVLGANLYVFAPLKRQIPTVKAVGVQLLTKIMLFFVIFLGSLAGFILAPLYCAVRFLMWRTAFVKHWKN